VSNPPHRRPSLRSGFDDTASDDGWGEADRSALAHRTAAAVLNAARSGETDPPVDLVERLGGLETVAELWQHAEPGSLPRTLLALHLLRAWCRGNGREAARLYREGLVQAEVDHAVAGVVSPPGPEDVAAVADAVLTSTYSGDLAVALERAAAFCLVVGSGRRSEAHTLAGSDPAEATRQLRLAEGNARAARDLTLAAKSWRAGTLT
jgi:hypothetical protein